MNTQNHNLATPTPFKTDRLLGWDTVFAIRYNHVNDAIAASGKVPGTFEHVEQDEGDTNSIEGTFTNWSVTVGGAGHLIMMKLDVPSVTLKRTGHTDQVRTDVEYIVKVQLTTEEAGPGPDQGQLVNFVLASAKHGANTSIVVEEVNYDGSESDTTVRFFLRGLMEDWLNENSDKFDMVFATVNLNSRADKDHWQWLRPTHTSYAVSDDHTTLESGILGVMCMTEHRPAPPDQEITHETIPEGKNGAFLLSKERFMTKLLRRGMGDMIDGPVTPDSTRTWPDDYFELTDDDTMLTNTDDLEIKELVLQEDEDPVRVEIPARTMIMKLEDNYLDVHFEQMNHPYKWLIGFGYLVNVSHEIQTRNIARLDNGCFTLFPGTKTLDPNYKVAKHRATAVKTDAARKLDVVLIVLGILSIVLPLVRWGWTRWIAEGAEEIEGGAAAAGQMVQEAEATAAEVATADAAGAQAGLQILEGETQTWTQWFMAQITARRAAIMGVMSAAGFTMEQLLPYLADKDAQKELPHYDEFAAEVLKPVAWPYSSGFNVTEIDFNSGFQTIGEPEFDLTQS